MTVSNMLHILQNPSQAGGEGKPSLWFALLSFHSFSVYLCHVKWCYFTQLATFNGLGWYGTAVGMATLVTEQYVALQFLQRDLNALLL